MYVSDVNRLQPRASGDVPISPVTDGYDSSFPPATWTGRLATYRWSVVGVRWQGEGRRQSSATWFGGRNQPKRQRAEPPAVVREDAVPTVAAEAAVGSKRDIVCSDGFLDRVPLPVGARRLG